MTASRSSPVIIPAPANVPADSGLSQIGARLRAARTKQDVTLTELARRSGISASTLSRLESGQRQPNLELLVPVTRALRISLDELLPTIVPDPRIRRTAQRRGRKTVLPLSPDTAPVRTFKVTLEPDASTPDPRVHDGYEWLYVLTGRLRLILGEHDLILGPGEAAEFDTRTPHWMSAAGTRPVELLSIFSESGERIHTRARPAAH